MTFIFRSLLWAVFSFVLPAAVLAQESEPASAEEPGLAVAPKLIELIAAEVPPDTPFPAPEVAVTMEIEVDERGAVGEVRLAGGAGEPFDSAALAAARKFRFEPARLTTGEAVPVTVTFRMRIQAPPPPEPAPAAAEKPPEPVVFSGFLIERGTRRPLSGVEVSARIGEDVLARAVTAENGSFRLEVPAPDFELTAYPAGHEPLLLRVQAEPGEQRSERFYLELAEQPYEIVVRATRIKREVTQQVITRREVERLPGTQGDTLKVVQNLPGVARASFGSGALILRGASPDDSGVFLEGQPIPLLYHFGGLRSAFHPAFLESVTFTPGNFGPDYGRLMGGVVEVKVRDPADDLFRGQADVNLYDAGFALEGPLGGGWSLGGAFHRSYIDTLLPLFLPDDTPLSFDSAPRYYDYQLLASWKPSESRRLRLLFYGSMDKVEILFKRPASDPVIRGDLDARLMFHYLQAHYRDRPAPDLSQESSAQLGYRAIETQIGPDLFFRLRQFGFSGRTSWEWEAKRWLSLRAGMDIRVNRTWLEANSPLRPTEGENNPPTSTRQVFGIDREQVFYNPAAFLEATFRPAKELQLMPSLRLDWYREIERFTLDPRLAARWQVREGTVLKGGVGYFQQPPQPDQVDEVLGNPDLMAQRSSHTSLGIEQRLFGALEIDFSGFYKWLDRLSVRNPEFYANPEAGPYLSAGVGRIYGIELLIKARVGEWFSAWLAYTFQRSFRKDRPGEPERRFDFDQPHILTVVGTFDIGRGWSAGLRFRLVSGNPATPVIGSIYDAGSGTWVPVYGPVNSERLATFHQLDVRVDKTWTFDRWKLSLYLDVQNVYNQGNQEGWSYSFDYRQRSAVTGLPILPLLGVKGEW